MWVLFQVPGYRDNDALRLGEISEHVVVLLCCTIPTRDAGGLARDPAYKLNFVGYREQPTKLSLYAGLQARPFASLIPTR